MANRLVFIMLGFVFFLFSVDFAAAQNIKKQVVVQPEVEKDTLSSAAVDSLQRMGALTQIITYSSKDSIVYDFAETDTLMILYKDAKVLSEDVELQSDYMEMNRRMQTVYAQGMPDPTDSTGVAIIGKPLFKEGAEEYKMDSLVYNYKTKKARILNVISKQGEGFLHGAVTKRMEDNSTYIKNGKYTTCDHEHPHFYLQMSQGKIVDGEKKTVVFGPSYLVVEDVPFPLVIPFGFFPQMSDRASGIKFPTYGEEVSRGFYLDGLGIYLAIGEYMDLDITSSIYSLGSKSIRSASRYTKRYKFDGNFDLQYNYNVFGEKGSTDYRTNNDFSITWRHSMSPKAWPGHTFSANVNFKSVGADKYNNQHNPYQSMNNSASSSISYARVWAGTPFNFSANLSHSQNMRDSTYAVTLPNLTFSVGRISPFERKDRVGKKQLYEEISFTYNATFDNKVNFKSSEMGGPDFLKKFNTGLQHRFGINLPSFTLLKYLKLNPSISYNTNWFFKSKSKAWDAEKGEVAEESTKAFSQFGATHEYSFGASLDTRIYGMKQFKKGSMVQAIRHVMKPSLSFSYTPDLRKPFNGYRTYQKGSSTTDIAPYNIYEGQLYGYPQSGESGSIGFSLGNTLEMKVRNRKDKDTTAKGGFKKISLLDNLNFSTSYNLLADSLNMSDISVNGTTNFLGLSLNFRASFDPYALNEKGIKVNRFFWKEKKGLNFARFKSFNTSVNYSLNSSKNSSAVSSAGLANANTGLDVPPETDDAKSPDHPHNRPLFNPLMYDDFDVPWNVSFSYNYDYRKAWRYNEITKILTSSGDYTHTLNFNGAVTPSENWRIGFSSGYDIKMMKITTTRFQLARKLHCFEFSFDWTPSGSYQNWNFRIAINSSMLSDIIKYEKRSSIWDNR